MRQPEASVRPGPDRLGSPATWRLNRSGRRRRRPRSRTSSSETGHRELPHAGRHRLERLPAHRPATVGTGLGVQGGPAALASRQTDGHQGLGAAALWKARLETGPARAGRARRVHRGVGSVARARRFSPWPTTRHTGRSGPCAVSRGRGVVATGDPPVRPGAVVEGCLPRGRGRAALGGGEDEQ